MTIWVICQWSLRLPSPTYVNGCVQIYLSWTRTKPRAKELTDFSISFGGNIIHNTRPYVKNLGAYFDRTLSMEKQCNAIARSCYFHIRNIGCIRPFISEDACKMLVNALVTSRLDYGNALFYGITKNTRTKKMDHITPVLIRLHWLLVEYRSQYKLIL